MDWAWDCVGVWAWVSISVSIADVAFVGCGVPPMVTPMARACGAGAVGANQARGPRVELR